MCLKVSIYTQEVILMNTKHITNYKPKDFAELLGVSVKTLQRWDRENVLNYNRKNGINLLRNVWKIK